jgi:hypothetical protein
MALIFNPFELSTLLTIPSEVRIILDFKYQIDFKTAEYLFFGEILIYAQMT